MFTVYFRNSTATPSQPGLQTLVEAALAECGARRTDQVAHIRLRDGADFYLFGEDDDDGMLAEYPELTPSVAEAVYAISDRTSAFVIGDLFAPVAMSTARNAGEVRAADMSVEGPFRMDDVDVLREYLAEIPSNLSEPDPVDRRTRSQPSTLLHDRSPLQKFLDFLFGRAV